MTDRYAVIGNPIEHSLSPQIHAAFARQTGQDLAYGRLLGEPDRFEDQVQAFFDEGGSGLNVTLPFKERAYRYAGIYSERARLAGAVNTLMHRDGALFGDNTDGAGLVTDLACNHRFSFAGARVLLLGAGGAARGVLLPLLAENPAGLMIANRTAAKAESLADALGDTRVTGMGLDGLAGHRFDLIINGTAAGLSAEVPAIPDDCLAADGWTYDMLYGREPTAFVRWGEAHAAGRALDGLGMLVEQAAAAFNLWRNVQPETADVIDELRGR